ncbi:hypothetical protein Glove_478g94 [Diversispora epigaea]|uniref:DUF6570 domain-containing protein n=1 Tax=Diversispora epigaea TaxID=1348612 RepID=A0A397GKM5_9GLOM|nr:hypothetical protein Glove_478g94 [Diversispora epigaea]
MYSTDGKNNDPFNLRICNGCKRSLDANHTLIFSLANMWIGTTPRCLQGLTILEQLLISTGYMYINLIQITNRKHTHHKIKDHVITFTQEPTSLSTILSLPLYRLYLHAKLFWGPEIVVFVGEERPSEKQLKKMLCVRKNKIVTALEWLMDHNVLYKNVKLDKTALDSLLVNGVPTALLATTVMVNVKPEEIEHYTGYVTDSIDENEMGNDIDDVDEEELSDEEGTSGLCDSTDNSAELRNSGMTYTDGVPISEQERTLKLLEKLIQKSTVERISSHAILMPHSKIPKNKYVDPSLLPAAFPTLFPYGVGGHEDNFRKYRIPFNQYIGHLLQLREPKFRHHRSFIFATFDILRRREIASGTYLTAKQTNFERSANLILKLTLNDVKIVIEQEQNDQPITNGAILELTKNVNVVDFHSSIVMMYAGKEIDVNTLLPEDFPTVTERARLAHLDPTAVAKYFNIVIGKIIKFIFGYKKPGGGVLGAPDPIELRNRLKFDDFRERLMLYINDVIKEDISYLFPNGD